MNETPALSSSPSGPTVDAAGVAFVIHLLDLGLPSVAATEAERLIRLEPDATLSAGLLLKLARATWQAGAQEEAISFYDRAIDVYPDPAVQTPARLELAWIHLAREEGSAALAQLLRVEAFGATPELRTLASRLVCIAWVVQQNPDAARQCWVETGLWEHWGAQTRARAGKLLRRLEAGPRWTPYAAAVLSAVLPGAGQATAGELADGLNAFVLNGAWIAGSVTLVSLGMPFEAGLVAVGFGERYYVGNVRHAFRLTLARQGRRRQQAARELIQLSSRPLD